MNETSDFDDSAFLPISCHKRKGTCNDINIGKKLKLFEHTSTCNMKERSQENVKVSNLADSIYGFNINTSCTHLNQEIQKDDASENGEMENKETKKLMQSNRKEYFSCPLCLKMFESEVTHVIHIKQCARKSKLTAKQMLEALELHKKQLKESLTQKLPNLLRRSTKTPVSLSSDSFYELSLGLALSKSSSEVEIGCGEKHESYSTLHITKEPEKSQGNTKAVTPYLESFGFIKFNGRNPAGPSKEKHNLMRNYLRKSKLTRIILRERTPEERAKIITEKAAVILLSVENEDSVYTNETPKPILDSTKENKHREPYLWKCAENGSVSKWHVDGIKRFILFENSSAENSVRNENRTGVLDDINKEIEKLNLPKSSVYKDWEKLINNKHLSDLTFYTKDLEIIFLHSVVIYSRCPSMLNVDLKAAFSKFTKITVINFLYYLYCGVFYRLTRSHIADLLSFGQLVHYDELVDILIILQDKINCSVGVSSTNAIGKDAQTPLTASGALKNYNARKSLENYSLSSDDASVCISSEQCTSVNISEPRNSENTDGSVKSLQNRRNKGHLVSTKLEDNIDNDSGSDILDFKVHKEDFTCETVRRWGKVNYLENDMFEEVENIDENMGLQFEMKLRESPECRPSSVCTVTSSDSSRDDILKKDNAETLSKTNNALKEVEYEIPDFDPYEHFSDDIAVLESQKDGENMSQDPPVLLGEAFLTKEDVLSTNDFVCGSAEIVESVGMKEGLVSHELSPPGISSTPVNTTLAFTACLQSESTKRRSLKKCKRKLNVTHSSKRYKKCIGVSGITNTVRSRGIETVARSRKNYVTIEKDLQKLPDFLSESILNDFQNSIDSCSKKFNEKTEKCCAEMTPLLSDTEYSHDVSPLPDYSLMGVSTMKRHLARYGLKKSLSKNKAKRILRHIYEELHPTLNLKNGKIVKCSQGEDIGHGPPKPEKNCCGSTCVINEMDKTASGGTNKTSEEIQCESQEEEYESFIESNTSGGSWETDLSEEELSQNNSTNGMDASRAALDLIRKDRDLYKRILTYEPIWLEDFRNRLNETYNKKFKLTDLMDCLDAECVSFRHKVQKRYKKIQRKS